MDPDDPNNRILSITLKHFLDYSASITNSEDAIYNLRTPDDQQPLSHLQVVDVPHQNVALKECWNFLDIPLSTSGADPKIRCVSPRLSFSSYLTSLFSFSAFDDISKHNHRWRSDNERWETDPSPFDWAKNWMITSNMSSFSEPHIDAAGYCTTMKMLCGSKLWYLQCKQPSSVPSAIMPKYQQDWDTEEGSWCAAHLMPGDIL